MRLRIPDEPGSSSCGSRWLSSFLSCEAMLLHSWPQNKSLGLDSLVLLFTIK